MSEINIQPQSGLGDLLYAMPLIYDLCEQGHVNVATNHGYAIPRTKEFENISIIPVDFISGMIPKIKEGFTHLKYDKYRKHFFETYYAPYAKNPIEESIDAVRSIYAEQIKYIAVNVPETYTVYAPPRAAIRHLHKRDSEKYLCAPDQIQTEKALEKYNNMPMVVVGKNDVYAPWVKIPDAGIDMRNGLSFWELCKVISGASYVISQVSAITTIAGLFKRPTHVLKSAEETDKEHETHINGIVWPGQQLIR